MYNVFPSNLVVALYKLELPIAEMARLFGVSKNTIYSRIKQYDIEELPFWTVSAYDVKVSLIGSTLILSHHCIAIKIIVAGTKISTFGI